MARNPFEQLQDIVTEPRQAFEDITAQILKCLFPDSRRIRVYRGDGGIDSLRGTMGDGGKADVYQIKFFPAPWGDSQKQQIREAYQTSRNCKDYQLGKWTLCVPTRLTKEDLRWFDEWKAKQDRAIEIMDGDDLTAHLADDRCATVRQKLRTWGAMGLHGGRPLFAVRAFIRPRDSHREGFIVAVVLRLENLGDRSAHALKATIKHAETACVSHKEPEDWQAANSSGCLNPRILQYRHTLNPGDHTALLSIPLNKDSTIPFWISIKLTADDCQPSELHCQITDEHLRAGQPVLFESVRSAN